LVITCDIILIWRLENNHFEGAKSAGGNNVSTTNTDLRDKLRGDLLTRLNETANSLLVEVRILDSLDDLVTQLRVECEVELDPELSTKLFKAAQHLYVNTVEAAALIGKIGL
jgi:hypothetical protein